MTITQPKFKRGDKVRCIKGKYKGQTEEVTFGTESYVHARIDGQIRLWHVDECEKVEE